MSEEAIIIGRKIEQKVLDKLFNSNKSEFLAIYGRRRVGKTYLVRNFFKKKDCIFFKVTGIHLEPMKRQLKEFTKELGKIFYGGTELKVKNNWFDTFELLLEAIKRQVPKDKKIILFFDEFPWMVTHRSKLLQAVDYYWNQHFSDDKRIKLIICGSAASWIVRNIINNKGGLHNRLTRTIHLEPMSLKETKLLLNYNGVRLNNKHVTEIYMVCGGIPYYLSHIESGLSSTQIIEDLCFSKNSFFLKEFNNLYASLFEQSEEYIELVRVISSKKYGMRQEELFHEANKFSKGGRVIKKLKELECNGFIMSFKPYSHQRKGIYYKVIDEYSLFYFQWIEPVKEMLMNKSLRKGYWQDIKKMPTWHSWSGYAFEAICYKHLPQISVALSLEASSVPSTWQYRKGIDSENGCQIDLLFDRYDDSITICEIKYTVQPFVIDKNYANKLQNKIDVFKKVTKTTKQTFLAFISAQGLKKNIYSENIVAGLVILDDLFKEID